MTKRVTTWLAGLAFIATLRKLFTSQERAARYNSFSLRSRRRRSMMPWQQRRFAFPWQQRRVSRLNAFRPVLLGLGLGAVLMYLFDTRMGNRRRALVRDQATYMAHATEDAVGKTSRDVRNRATGVMTEMQKGPGEGNGTGQASGGTSSLEPAQENWSPGVHMLGGRREELQPTQDAGPWRREAGQVQAQPAFRQDDRSVELAREPVGEDAWEGRGGELPPAGDIPRAQWEHFCRTFGRLYAGWLVSVETHYPGGSESTIATGQPLLELSSEQHDGRFDLRLVLGDDATETLAHNVTNVENLHLQANTEGGHEELQVRTPDSTTSVRFRAPDQA